LILLNLVSITLLGYIDVNALQSFSYQSTRYRNN
jgi:hypothetical protein